MPRLVRRRPLLERIASMLNPMDFLLWLSEEMETRDWDSGLVGTQLGLGLNFIFLLARANSGQKPSRDDVFGDTTRTTWLSFLAYPLVWGLVAFSLCNAFYTMSRTRKYRMFEANIETQPSTPSARRVKAQSSPTSSSPLRFIADMMTPESAESRAHPDHKTDVWELSVWDPLPVCVRLFSFFSPGHVLVYLMFLPLAPLDLRPSLTVFNILVMQTVLSAQLLLLCARFTQQSKDTTIIQREVMHEYDTKFVHPRLYPTVRDVGVQASDEHSVSKAPNSVQFGSPSTLLRRSFKPHQNPHADPSEATPVKSHTNLMKPHMFASPAQSVVLTTAQRGTAQRPALAANYSTGEGRPAPSVAPSPGGHNFGGHMGIYTHDKSPLKKTMSLGNMNGPVASPRNSREMAAYEQRNWEPPNSPTKRSEQRKSLGTGLQAPSTRLGNMGGHRQPFERYPSLR